MTTDRATTEDLTAFRLKDAEVRLSVPEGWTANKNRSAVNLFGREPGTVPVPAASIAVVEGTPRESLEQQVEHAGIALTDFTVLHLESREVRADNWVGADPDPRFVFGTYRQGIWTIALLFGTLGSHQDERCATFSSVCGFESLVDADATFDQLVSGTEIRW